MSRFLALFLMIPLMATAASDITGDRLVGNYNIEVRVANKKGVILLDVLSPTQFQVARIRDGQVSQFCPGTYTLENEFTDPATPWRVFKGFARCPDDPNKQAHLTANFKALRIKDIKRGAWITVSTSLLPGYIFPAYMKSR